MLALSWRRRDARGRRFDGLGNRQVDCIVVVVLRTFDGLDDRCGWLVCTAGVGIVADTFGAVIDGRKFSVRLAATGSQEKR